MALFPVEQQMMHPMMSVEQMVSMPSSMMMFPIVGSVHRFYARAYFLDERQHLGVLFCRETVENRCGEIQSGNVGLRDRPLPCLGEENSHNALIVFVLLARD